MGAFSATLSIHLIRIFEGTDVKNVDSQKMGYLQVNMPSLTSNERIWISYNADGKGYLQGRGSQNANNCILYHPSHPSFSSSIKNFNLHDQFTSTSEYDFICGFKMAESITPGTYKLKIYNLSSVPQSVASSQRLNGLEGTLIKT